MKRTLALIAASTAALLAAPSPLAAKDEIATISVLTGECQKLVVGGVDQSSICAGRTANFAYRSGHSSFQFAGGDVVAIGFYGTDHEAQGDEAFITVERLSLNAMKGSPSTSIPASGKCSYTNPYAGPSRIQCSAISSGKVYSATFVSDGGEPAIQRF
ncbi:MAG: hypothetical protein JWO25_672 [Alphaproteobacteria bacterium]|nr:hypothetical protein [Alphaproteobacteria bacterium]